MVFMEEIGVSSLQTRVSGKSPCSSFIRNVLDLPWWIRNFRVTQDGLDIILVDLIVSISSEHLLVV